MSVSRFEPIWEDIFLQCRVFQQCSEVWDLLGEMWQTVHHVLKYARGFKHKAAVAKRLYKLMCSDCALCAQDPPHHISSGLSPLTLLSCTYCADYSNLQLDYKRRTNSWRSFLWRWQCISVCSLILHWPLGGRRDQTKTNINYKFHHLVHPRWFSIFNSLTWNSFCAHFFCASLYVL